MARATLLISQQSLYPHAGCTWVQAAKEAVRWCRENNHSVVTAIGVPTRNLVTALCAIEHVSCELALPSKQQMEAEHILSDYGLSRGTTTISLIDSPGTAPKEARLHFIDDYVFTMTDIVIPVSSRERGYMQQCGESAERDGKPIIRDFAVPYESASDPAGYKIDPESLSDGIRRFSEPYLIHWTRTSNGPWPQERSIDYYRDVAAIPHYPRTAFDTLCRILATKLLYASSRHIASAEPVVAFSSLHPREVIPLMRWRARYRQMSFEPYGVGIRKSVGTAAGILPVRYGVEDSGASDEAWLTQSIGKRTDWRQESEYRHRGTLHLEQIADTDLCVFTRTKEESRRVTERFGVQSIWFGG